MVIEVWELLDPRGAQLLGYLPQIIKASDGRPVVEQVNANYAHGGGWRKFDGFKLLRPSMGIKYPGDPVFKPVAKMEASPTETVYVYPYAWVLIDRGGDDWEIARLD